MFEMRYLVRSLFGGTPLLHLDVRTGSTRTMLSEVRARVREHGDRWDDVQVTEAGERPLRGAELRRWIERLESS